MRTGFSTHCVGSPRCRTGKYAQAQTLFEKALEIYRRLLGEDHPEIAHGYKGLASNLIAQGLGRGLLDELAARRDRRLAPPERARLRELTAALERLDKLVEANPKGLGQAERAKRIEELKRQRELASVALGEFQTKRVEEYEALAGQVATLDEIRAALPADAALVAWVDLAPPGPNAAAPGGSALSTWRRTG